jgi:UDP-GlcNAc:undecaprenyl-phosphate/decaprenyl-phosphate GlcNAc-1-phosphate transferase
MAALVVPAVVATLAIALLRRSPWAGRLADVPNERSLHGEPRARLGGIGLMVAALAVAGWFATDRSGIVLMCSAALAAVSALDDRRSLPIQVRLPAHLLAAIVAVAAIGTAGFTGVAAAAFALLAVLTLAWMTNLFNFMDGTDGLAGGMALFGFGAYAFGAANAGEPALALVCAAIASASAGFLFHNFPPARVFLGDAGSIPLGFLAGALGLQGYALGAWPVWFPALVFSPFIVDATVTIARRAQRGEPVWRAHRDHYYQRLVLSGWSHRRLAICAYALMAALAASALAARAGSSMLQCSTISGWALAYLLLLALLERRLPRAHAAVRAAPERSAR